LSTKFVDSKTWLIGRSRQLRQWLIVIHSLASLANLSSGLEISYKLLILLLILYSLRCYLLKDKPPFKPEQLRYSSDEAWQLAITSADFQIMRILPSTVVTSAFIVLHARVGEQKLHRVIFKDALTDNDYRALVSYLKITASLNE
jgi:hypothetical protein